MKGTKDITSNLEGAGSPERKARGRDTRANLEGAGSPERKAKGRDLKANLEGAGSPERKAKGQDLKANLEGGASPGRKKERNDGGKRSRRPAASRIGAADGTDAQPKQENEKVKPIKSEEKPEEL